MFGFWCCLSAASVAAGTESFLVNSTVSPERADHAAAGIEYSGASADATITSPDGLPFATLENLSMATATAYGSAPLMRAAFSPLGGPGLSPTRIACAPLASCAPFGFSRSSVSEVTGGSEPPSVRRIGARSGAATSAAAATAPCQSFLSTSTTAGGRVSSDEEGKRALATPAASAVGVATAHARGVAGGADREAELLGGLACRSTWRRSRAAWRGCSSRCCRWP